ncbi:STAS domain-containing protein [Thermospira aquatica]|uniref:Anti-sigma factor antagonist n=1 Tax=Thermospira aquatica TaxID=2828656 RepID=A0AAX3BF99_9SPIR|nr:STAS domain-containing protein [Thermospira aquatica]URA10950.1 STAS domain-containing protein [Thermospira aquatica]
MAGFQVTKTGNVVVLKISGEMDAHTAPQMDKALKEAIAQGNKIVLDVSQMTYVATAALGVLIANNNVVKTKGGKIVIAGMLDKIRKVFDTMGFSKVFPIASSVDEAKNLF